MEPMRTRLARFVVGHSREPSPSWVESINQFPIVPLRGTESDESPQYGYIRSVIDPTSLLSKLYFETEDVRPSNQFFQEHQTALVACGLRQDVTTPTVLERVQFYSNCQDLDDLPEKVKALISTTTTAPASLDSPVGEIINSAWLPALKSGQTSHILLPPSECRGRDDSAFVDRVLGIVNMRIAGPWKRLFGWNKPVEANILVQQLNSCLKERRHGHVSQVLIYITKHHDAAVLQPIECILSKGQKYIRAEQALLPDSNLHGVSLAPFLDEVDEEFAKTHIRLLESLGVRPQLDVNDIIDLQNTISVSTGGVVNDPAHFDLIVRSLKVASRILNGRELARCSIPDTQKKLKLLHDLVHGDRILGASSTELNFVHPEISPGLVNRLGIESVAERISRLQIEIDDEDDDEYAPCERLTTVIEDNLGRYLIQSTFSEFLANAEDCHASKISWLLDLCDRGPYRYVKP